ncbi:MAG: hypothetical protein AAFN07_04910 [Pseudomonadota bacterium]
MENFDRITRHMVVEHNLVDRYLMNQLTEEQSMAFEDFYAGCPETMEELDLSERLMKQVKQTAAPAGEVASLQQARERKSALHRLFTSPVYSAAASFFAVAAIAVMAIGSSVQTEQPLGTGNVTLAYLEPTRGADEGVDVSLSGATEVLLALDLGMAVEDTYEATVLNGEGDLISTVSNLKSVDGSELTVLLRGAAATPGAYRINVRNTTGETWVFPYRVTE